MKDEFGKYYEAVEPGRRERARAWATAIGLQDVDGLKPSKYLRSKGYEVANDLFKDKSFYFRNALVRANYENQRLNVVKTRLPLEEFFKVLLFGYDLELKNRFLRIGCEYGSSVAEGMSGLHRIDVGTNGVDVGVNVGVKLSRSEENAIKSILRDKFITAAELGRTLTVSKRQAERIIAALRKKVGLVRKGSDKNGEWHFSQSEP